MPGDEIWILDLLFVFFFGFPFQCHSIIIASFVWWALGRGCPGNWWLDYRAWLVAMDGRCHDGQVGIVSSRMGKRMPAVHTKHEQNTHICTFMYILYKYTVQAICLAVYCTNIYIYIYTFIFTLNDFGQIQSWCMLYAH